MREGEWTLRPINGNRQKRRAKITVAGMAIIIREKGNMSTVSIIKKEKCTWMLGRQSSKLNVMVLGTAIVKRERNGAWDQKISDSLE